MKLLLTSAGLMNKSISETLLKLAGKPFEELNLAFVPTAANMEEGDKGWLIKDLVNCQKLGFKTIDIVDISALPKKTWKGRLGQADILMFSGGNTFHLRYWLKKSGLEKLLPELLKTRVYVGISAGSVVTSKSIALSQAKKLYHEGIGLSGDERGLGFVDFHIRPHLNSPKFPKVTIENLEKLAKKIPETIYAIDDQSAIVVDGDKITVVSEGEWKKFN